MSAHVQTRTPYTSEVFLTNTLRKNNISFQRSHNRIETPNGIFQKDNLGKFAFVAAGSLLAAGAGMLLKKFMDDVERDYKNEFLQQNNHREKIRKRLEQKQMEQKELDNVPKEKQNMNQTELEKIKTEQNKRIQEQKKLEDELKKAEELKKQSEVERKKYIESQKQAIYEKAKSKGYAIKEKQKGNKIQLVLVKTNY